MTRAARHAAHQAWRLLRFLLVTEWRMYVGAVRLVLRRPDVAAGATPLPYVGAVAFPLWAFTAVSLVELVALHLVLPWPTVRLAADVLGIWGVVWCLGLTGCHYVYPHLLTPDALRLRSLRSRDAVTVPWDLVAAVRLRERTLDSGRAVQVHDRVARVTVDKRTDVELVLVRPITVEVRGVTHEVDEVHVQLDEPRAAARELRARARGGAVDAV